MFSQRGMGTSVTRMEDHYGHVSPVKNAHRFFSACPVGEQIASAAGIALIWRRDAARWPAVATFQPRGSRGRGRRECTRRHESLRLIGDLDGRPNLTACLRSDAALADGFPSLRETWAAGHIVARLFAGAISYDDPANAWGV